MPKMNLVQAINSALRQEMRKDRRVVLLGEDVGIDGGVFRVTKGLLKEFGPNRVIDTPISESGFTGLAIGMAAFGMRPVVEIQFEGFSYPAFDQIISHAARLRTRSRGRFTCPMVVRMPYSGGIRALEHHQESNEAIYIHTPGVKVVIPSTPYDAKGLLISAIRDPDPVIFMESKRLYRSVVEDVPGKPYAVEIGKANVRRQGEDVTVVSYGSVIMPCLEAAEEAEKKGVSIEVIDLRTVSPIDTDAIIESVKKTGRCVVAHEAPRTCGLGAEIAAQVCEKALLSLKAPVLRVTGYDTPNPLAKLEKYYQPDKKRVLAAIRQAMEF